MNFIANIFMFFVTLVVMIIAFVLHIAKVLTKRIKEILISDKNKEVKIESNALNWHGVNIKFDDIKMILYGVSSKNKYIFWYVLKDEDIYQLSSSYDAELFYKRRHLENKENSIILGNALTSKSLILVPSLWLMKPVGLMGCSITGGFKKNNFITLAGDNNQICIYKGLDCNPSNFPIKMTTINSFSLDNNIFTKQKLSTLPNRYKSKYQAYVINKSLTLSNKYLFLPWKDGKFLFKESSYHNNLEELTEKIINYFKYKNTTLVISDKNCLNRNNP
jgi:hypothetical protein